MNRRFSGIIVVLSLIAVSVPVMGQRGRSASKRILLHVEETDSPTGRSEMNDALVRSISSDPSFRIVSNVRNDENDPPFPSAGYDLDSLLEWGREKGGRYLLDVRVFDLGIRNRKKFSIPLILHHYETVVEIEGEMRLIDLKRGMLMHTQTFSEHLKAKQVFQGDAENNRNDPDLHLPAPEKSRLVAKLESKLADKLAQKVSRLARGR